MEIGRIFQESTSDYFYFILNKDSINFVSIGSILKIIIKDKIYYAIIEELKAEEKIETEDYDALQYLYQTKLNQFIIYGKAIFIGRLDGNNILPQKPDVPPLPGDPVYLPEDNEIDNLYSFNEDIVKVPIGDISLNNKKYSIFMNVENLIRHLGIFGITGSGKSTTVAHIVNELNNRNQPILLLDVHRDYILSFDNSIIITFSQQEKEFIEKLAKERNKNVEVLVGKINLELLTKYSQEFIGLHAKQGPKIIKLLKNLINKIKDKKEDLTIENLIKEIENLEKEKGKISQETVYSLSSRIDIIKGWLLFQRNIKDLGGDYINIINNLIDNIVNSRSNLYGDFIENENEEVIVKKSEEKKYNLIIIDLYPLSIEEQRILIDITLDFIFNKYKELKLRNNPDILYIFIEEAHRFASKDAPSAYYISTIAREGRKFGLGLILISQIPSKISEDIISQINSFLFLKIINPSDLEFIKRTCPYLSKEYFEALTKLETGKCLAVGLSFKNPAILQIRKTVDVGGSEEDIRKRIRERAKYNKN